MCLVLYVFQLTHRRLHICLSVGPESEHAFVKVGRKSAATLMYTQSNIHLTWKNWYPHNYVWS